MRSVLASALALALSAATAFGASDRSQVPLSGPTDHDADELSLARGPLVPQVSSLLSHAVDRLAGAVDSAAIDVLQGARHPRLSTELADSLASGAGGRDRTLYELIRACEHTSRFADAVDHHPDVVKLLNGSSSRDLTLFVPTNAAFRGLPDSHKPGREFVERVLKYHVGLGRYPAGRILQTHTLPTALDEELLAGEPQRLRTSIGLGGVEINFYSKVVAINIEASNGIIHAVNHILIPPFMVGRILSLFPSQFSTLLLAYEKTDFVDFIHHVSLNGSTVFAPSNNAFGRLGPRANAFLFNTSKGRRYLRALLKYHISPNATLYTDAFYDATTEDAAGRPSAEGLEREHYDLPTLLGDARIGVDIARLGGFSAVRVNGFAHISVRDGVAKNGVIQVVDQVLMPPRKGHPAARSRRALTVKELMARLEPYL
ncbi:fasciclin domain-containing protein [Ophiocordyceps camponoti-floridani]|uniref:Fasciclin domain-containing protein n=1 Tax=Ophiocordyceps camponoti-floridani TaxID=2030778 RepID=A0A8H4QB92_9HYPO|nr:fasciclin domain-containing protein [Ophiocordyceps camponoti-floridani]